MYYPYLRSRQFELIALRELALEEISQGYITPIIEPVKSTFNNINIAVEIFKEKNQKAFFILNPQYGDMSGDTNYYLNYHNSDEVKKALLPAFIINENTEYINKSISDYDLNDCMLLCDSSINIDNIIPVLKCGKVNKVVLNEPERNRQLTRSINNFDEVELIRLDDLFTKEARNEDYLDLGAKLFSEEHIYYREDKFSGFSDFTTIPSEFVTGGSTPRAVVIHLTYFVENKSIWIRHFTSNNNGFIENVQGKFAEALEKAVKFIDQNEFSNSALDELKDYFKKRHYPGLGVVKKISIKNHLINIATFLKNETN